MTCLNNKAFQTILLCLICSFDFIEKSFFVSSLSLSLSLSAFPFLLDVKEMFFFLVFLLIFWFSMVFLQKICHYSPLLGRGQKSDLCRKKLICRSMVPIF